MHFSFKNILGKIFIDIDVKFANMKRKSKIRLHEKIWLKIGLFVMAIRTHVCFADQGLLLPLLSMIRTTERTLKNIASHCPR